MVRMNYNIKISTLVVVGLLFGFTFNAPIQYFVNPLRYFLLGIFLIGALLTIKNNIQQYNVNYAVLFFVIVLGLISLIFTESSLDIAIKELYVNLVMMLGFFAYCYYDKFKKLLLFLIVINFLVMLIDLYNGTYLFNFNLIENYHQVDRGKGLFSYSKEAGAFTIFAALLFRNDKYTILIILLSSIMTGSRSAMIFVFLIFVVDFLFDIVRNLNFKFFLYSILIMLFFSFLTYLYFLENISMWHRLISSFELNSSGHEYRFHIWNEYLQVISNFNVSHLLFGNTGFVNVFLGNGAENAYLTVIVNSGILVLLIMYLPMVLFAFLSIVNFRLFYPFILLLIIFQFGRQGLGWADGILLWAYIYHIIYSPYFKNTLRSLTIHAK